MALRVKITTSVSSDKPIFDNNGIEIRRYSILADFEFDIDTRIKNIIFQQQNISIIIKRSFRIMMSNISHDTMKYHYRVRSDRVSPLRVLSTSVVISSKLQMSFHICQIAMNK